MGEPTTAPISLHSVQFAFNGAPGVIALLDDAGLPVGREPEWTADGRRREVAAYIRGTRPVLRAVFRREPAALDLPPAILRVYAKGARGCGLAPQTVDLRFHADGPAALTDPVDFPLASNLPDRIGCVDLTLDWLIGDARPKASIGRSRHRLCLTWKEIRSPALWLGARAARRIGGGLSVPWTYARIVEWTCDWAAGLDDEKAIVDAILANLPRSGLRYAVHAEDVADMLRSGGGYCGVWARMFQAMAASQGVTVERHGFQVDWRELQGAAHWCAIVVTEPGINRTEPAWDPMVYHDAVLCEAGWPPGGARRPVQTRRERRYRFWGKPDGRWDGHAFDILQYRGDSYLYDPSFVKGPIALNWEAPPAAGTRVDVWKLGNFRKAYLERTVPYLLGVLPGSSGPGPGGAAAATAEVAVPTTMVPAGPDDITFYWVKGAP